VLRHGKRGKTRRFLCLKCSKSFKKDYSHNKTKPKDLASLYVDTGSLRKVGDHYGLSGTTVFRKAEGYLRELPSNLALTQEYCDFRKFGGYLVLDGKYVAVKGYQKKISFIWAADYQTHDIPYAILAPSENYIACLAFFSQLAFLGYAMRLLVCDDNQAIKMAARNIYPDCLIQSCTNHYRESLRRDLAVRTCEKYREFFSLVEAIFTEKLDPISFAWEVARIHEKLPSLGLKGDGKCLYWIGNLLRRRDELTAYHRLPDAPDTTNLIEAYNSHLQGRLSTIKGFKSFHSAKRWLNGYVLKRRLKPFRACGEKFKHLNGICSLSKTLKEGKTLPNFL
jgi:hypothetical protein